MNFAENVMLDSEWSMSKTLLNKFSRGSLMNNYHFGSITHLLKGVAVYESADK